MGRAVESVAVPALDGHGHLFARADRGVDIHPGTRATLNRFLTIFRPTLHICVLQLLGTNELNKKTATRDF